MWGLKLIPSLRGVCAEANSFSRIRRLLRSFQSFAKTVIHISTNWSNPSYPTGLDKPVF